EVSVDTYTERYRMLARDIYSLEEMRSKQAKYLEIRLQESQNNKLDELAKLLSQHRGGKCPLLIRYLQKDSSANLVPDAKWQVKLSESLLQMLRNLLSDDCVVVGY
ncbi:MAG TPA: hypothetical protein VHA13_04915, partial [Gammaproteobacteria bacterium]|nr:hypothetical protein [Gammaproteobacteria bacterium]